MYVCIKQHIYIYIYIHTHISSFPLLGAGGSNRGGQHSQAPSQQCSRFLPGRQADRGRGKQPEASSQRTNSQRQAVRKLTTRGKQ